MTKSVRPTPAALASAGPTRPATTAAGMQEYSVFHRPGVLDAACLRGIGTGSRVQEWRAPHKVTGRSPPAQHDAAVVYNVRWVRQRRCTAPCSVFLWRMALEFSLALHPAARWPLHLRKGLYTTSRYNTLYSMPCAWRWSPLWRQYTDTNSAVCK